MTTKIHKDDYKFFVEKGDPGFNPAHNTYVIEKTIQKYEAQREAKKRAYGEQVRERADAVATYLKSRWAESTTPIEKYFSRQELARLRGQKRVEKIRTLLNGKQYIEFEEVE